MIFEELTLAIITIHLVCLNDVTYLNILLKEIRNDAISPYDQYCFAFALNPMPHKHEVYNIIKPSRPILYFLPICLLNIWI